MLLALYLLYWTWHRMCLTTNVEWHENNNDRPQTKGNQNSTMMLLLKTTIQAQWCLLFSVSPFVSWMYQCVSYCHAKISNEKWTIKTEKIHFKINDQRNNIQKARFKNNHSYFCMLLLLRTCNIVHEPMNVCCVKKNQP